MNNVRVNFALKKPGKGRKSFSILKREFRNNKAKSKKLKLEAIDALNRALFTGMQDVLQCEQSAKEIIKSLYLAEERKNPKQVYNSHNRQLLEKYWKAEYEDRELVDYSSAKNDLKRAIDVLGPLSLYSSSKEEIQKQINKSVSGNNQRRVVMRLTQILRFIGRDVKLRKDKALYTEVKHLTLDEFKKILVFIESEELRLLHEVAFYTGVRIGEAFALNSSSLKDSMIVVGYQIDRDNRRRYTKSRNLRKAFVVPEGMVAVSNWCNREFDLERNQRFSKVTQDACRKAFPKNPSKWLVFHDLRHSYAIHLLSKGVSLSLVSQCLGNSVSVCQAYYTGFCLTDDAINSISKTYCNG